MKKHRMITFLLLVILLLQCCTAAYADGIWYCPKCGRKNDSNFCPADGTAKPADVGGSYQSNTSGNLRVGSRVVFGSYEQDNDTSDGKEAIEWVVLDVQGSRALLTSRYVLDGQQFDSHRENVKWENSTLRSWLNSSFLSAAFSRYEQNAILSVTMPEGCVDTVFLLSRSEVEKYYPVDADRLCVATPYATSRIYHQVNGLGEHATCRWWLRTIGELRHSAMYISHYDGVVYKMGFTEADYGVPAEEDLYNHVGVRPAMWVNLNSGLFG